MAAAPVPVPADLFRLEALHLALAGHGGTGRFIYRRQLCAFCQRLRRQRRGLGAGSQRGGSGRKSKGDFQKMTAFHDISLLAGIPQMTPELAWIFSIFLAPCKAKAQFGQLPPPRAARTVVEGLIWPFSLAFGRTPPSVALCLLYTSPSPRDRTRSRMPSS